ncbi:lactonase family protein [Liquorilactobacillus capillatus]|uniref:6-phosphogluconolactonase n=1 Tax=Liquorilactobacillus capillatus DSM 19910 TaxID=1423731 RepID=A0A0R1M4M1_9LACO|nr:lactonase family protein [Liquorilactobacillus capillatus]KRL03014.1 6-phosphogluconolactonase [Liquorilactobacillus capillatus DSM 19910]
MQETILFGTYTKRRSQGIYRAILDTETKKITTPELLVQVQNPTYLRVSADNILYTISKKEERGGIASYNLNNTTPTFCDEELTKGAPPCYIGLDNKKQLAFTANFHESTVTVFKTDSHGHLTKTDEIIHEGQGPLPEQEASHIHFTDLTPDNRLAVCDLGSDKIYTYAITTDGKLAPVAEFATTPGFAPRHLVFHPNGHYAFLVGEQSSQISLLAYDQTTGKFHHLQTLATIPVTWHKHNGAAAIRISQDGKFVYVSNRGHNSIAVFKFNPTARKLEFIESVSTQGDFPRDFILDSTERFLIAANQNTDNATLFSRNIETGKLDCLQKDILVPEGVCVSLGR